MEGPAPRRELGVADVDNEYNWRHVQDLRICDAIRAARGSAGLMWSYPTTRRRPASSLGCTSKPAMRLAGLFIPQARELPDIWYQFSAPYTVDGSPSRQSSAGPVRQRTSRPCTRQSHGSTPMQRKSDLLEQPERPLRGRMLRWTRRTAHPDRWVGLWRTAESNHPSNGKPILRSLDADDDIADLLPVSTYRYASTKWSNG